MAADIQNEPMPPTPQGLGPEGRLSVLATDPVTGERVYVIEDTSGMRVIVREDTHAHRRYGRALERSKRDGTDDWLFGTTMAAPAAPVPYAPSAPLSSPQAEQAEVPDQDELSRFFTDLSDRASLAIQSLDQTLEELRSTRTATAEVLKQIAEIDVGGGK